MEANTEKNRRKMKKEVRRLETILRKLEFLGKTWEEGCNA